MPYQSEVDERLGIVKIKYHDVVSLADRKEARSDVVRLTQEYGFPRALIDMRHCQMALSTMEIYEFGSTFNEAGLYPNIRIGGIISSQDDDDKFLEAVAGNRSATIKFFLNEGEALAWLGVPTDEGGIL